MKRFRFGFICNSIVALAFILGARVASAAMLLNCQDGFSPLFDGIEYKKEKFISPRDITVYVVKVDLNNSKIDAMVTPRSALGTTTSKFLNDFHLQLAINGDESTAPTNPKGLAAAEGDEYAPASVEPTIYISKENRFQFGGTRPSPLWDAISGSHTLVEGSAIYDKLKGCSKPEYCTDVHPRTSIGVTMGNTLVIMVVDGRQSGYSMGVTLLELAELFVQCGATSAINLDGGGSTTLVAQGLGVLNSPIQDGIPGKERENIANHLGFFSGSGAPTPPSPAPAPAPDPASCLAGGSTPTGPKRVYGDATKISSDIVATASPGGMTFKDDTLGIENLSISWVEDVAFPKFDPKTGKATDQRNIEKVKTYKTVQTVCTEWYKDKDGNNSSKCKKAEYDLKDLPDKNLFVMLHCGDKLIDTFGIDWDEAKTNEINLNFTYSYDLNCQNNNTCVRPNVDDRNVCKVQQADELKKGEYVWWKPTAKETTTWDVIALCLDHPLGCLKDIGSGLWAVAVNKDILVPTAMYTPRSSYYEDISLGLGCNPGIKLTEELPDCEAIKQVNMESGRNNTGKCGRIKLKLWAPSSLKKQGLLMANELGNKPVCKLNGATITLNQIKQPWGAGSITAFNIKDRLLDSTATTYPDPKVLGMATLPAIYYPYYLLANVNTDKAELVPNTGVDDEVFICGLVNGNCDPYSQPGQAENTKIEVTQKSGGHSPPAAEKVVGEWTVPALYRPGKDFQKADMYKPGKGSDLAEVEKLPRGISRVEGAGSECVCPGETKKDPTTGVCKDGGIKFSFLALLKLELCKANPLDPQCANIAGKGTVFSDPFLPRAIKIGNSASKLADSMIRPGGKKCPTDAGIGATQSTGIAEAVEAGAVPYSIYGLGTVSTQKECLQRLTKRPKDKVY